MSFSLKEIPSSSPRREKVELDYGIRVTRYGLWILIFLAIIKFVAWFFTGSVVLLADAVNTFTDIFGMLASYVGLSLSKKKAARDFRYGYYKVESFAALLVALLGIFLAYQIFIQSFKRFFTVQQVSYPFIGMAVSVISMLLLWYLSQNLDKAGQQINSPSLKNNAKDKFLGVLTSLLVIVGIAASSQQWFFVEGVIGLFMTFLILKVGLHDAKESMFFLLDYWDDPVLLTGIRSILKKYKRLLMEVKQIRLRRAGSVIFGEIFLVVNPFISIKDLRSGLDNIDREILALNPHFKDVILYTIVPKPKKIRVAVPIKRDNGLHSEIAVNFSSIKHFIFVDVVNYKIKKWTLVDFDFTEDQCAEISNYLKEHRLNILIASDLPSLVYFNLSSQLHFDIYPVFRNTKDVESLIKLLLIDT